MTFPHKDFTDIFHDQVEFRENNVVILETISFWPPWYNNDQLLENSKQKTYLSNSCISISFPKFSVIPGTCPRPTTATTTDASYPFNSVTKNAKILKEMKDSKLTVIIPLILTIYYPVYSVCTRKCKAWPFPYGRSVHKSKGFIYLVRTE